MEGDIDFEAVIYSIVQSPRPINARFWYIAHLKFLKSSKLSSRLAGKCTACNASLPYIAIFGWTRSGHEPCISSTHIHSPILRQANSVSWHN
jgi:hypothetical protein